MESILQATLGIIISLCVAFSLSENKKAISYKHGILTLAWLIGISFATRTKVVLYSFKYLNSIMIALSTSSKKACGFVFGYLATGDNPYTLISDDTPFILALQSLPVVILVSTILSLLFHFGIMQFIINNTAKFFMRALGVGSALGMGFVANIFVGLSQSPLIIKPYLSNLTRSELFSFICCGLAGSASAIAIIYAGVLNSVLENSMGHITTAMIMNVFTALLLARIVIPETQKTTQGQEIIFTKHNSAMDAIYNGIMDGSKVVINVIAMIIGFLGLIYLINSTLEASFLPGKFNSLENIIGLFLSPIAWLMGINEENILQAGSILASKLVMNELIAYQDLISSTLIDNEKNKIIMIYAICGFANLSSIGVIIGSYTVLAPNRKNEVTTLVVKAMLVGSIANFLTGTIVGIAY